MVWKVDSENDCSLCNNFFFTKIDDKFGIEDTLFIFGKTILALILGVTETFNKLSILPKLCMGKIFYGLSTGKAFFSGRSDLSGRTCTQGLKSLGRPDWSSSDVLFLCHGLHCSSHCFLLKSWFCSLYFVLLSLF